MAELVDAHASGACIFTDVEVRVLFWAPFNLKFMSEELQDFDAKEEEISEWAEFIANHPPGHGKPVHVKNLHSYWSSVGHLKFPDIELYCESPKCEGKRWFHTKDPPETELYGISWESILLNYECRNCGETKKRYWFDVSSQNLEDGSGFVAKNGEDPPFRPYVPRGVYRIFKDDKLLFENARSEENQGKGIGAFAYYRRIVENQKNRIIDQVIKVADKEGDQDLVKDLVEAKNEISFSKAVETIKEHIPDSIRIEGKNPLTLLHQALSKGIHAKTDEECLKLAGNIRIILSELVLRINTALEDKNEITKALHDLES